MALDLKDKVKKFLKDKEKLIDSLKYEIDLKRKLSIDLNNGIQEYNKKTEELQKDIKDCIYALSKKDLITDEDFLELKTKRDKLVPLQLENNVEEKLKSVHEVDNEIQDLVELLKSV